MLKLGSLLIGSEDPQKLSQFYKELLQAEPGWEGGEYVGFDAGGCYLVIGPHDKVHGRNSNPERILLNFETPDVMGEFTRVKAMTGVTVIQEPYHPGEDEKMTLVTLADPDGNYFQLASPM